MIDFLTRAACAIACLGAAQAATITVTPLDRIPERAFQTYAAVTVIDPHGFLHDQRFDRQDAAVVHPSITLVAAGASGFLILIQCGDRPDR